MLTKGRDYITLHPSMTSQLWIPDIFVDQAVQLRKPLIHTPPTSLRVYRDGLIRYSTRWEREEKENSYL